MEHKFGTLSSFKKDTHTCAYYRYMTIKYCSTCLEEMERGHIAVCGHKSDLTLISPVSTRMRVVKRSNTPLDGTSEKE